MPTLRLIADDLTGAIDSAVRFVGLSGPIPVRWMNAVAPTVGPAVGPALGSVAFDIGTRERDAIEAAARASAASGMLRGADIAYLKCDSLLRGHLMTELSACMAGGGFARCILAPAFPAQHRRTRQGRQEARLDGVWRVVGPDLATSGLALSLRLPGDPVPDGISLWDAESDADLSRIVAGAPRAGTLWCGSAGLAAALAGAPPPVALLRRPVLALLGSDHAVTAAQLAGALDWHVAGAHDPSAVAARLAQDGRAVVTIALPAGTARAAAATRIASGFATLLSEAARPATLFVTGGETLRAVCTTLGATELAPYAEVAAGVPASRLRGGRWDGVTVVSKSGAFGTPELLRELLLAAD